MLFVLYGTNVDVHIRNPVIRKIADEHGNLQVITDRPIFNAHFRAQSMTETQRVIAKRMFIERNPKAPFGSAPYPVGDAMGQEFSTEDVVPGTRYTGFDPAFSLAKFDTRVDIPYEEQGAFTDGEKAELKALTERVLLGGTAFGVEYFRLDDSLPKPWATYPMENGPGVAQSIIKTARDIGVPLSEVIEFERSQDDPKRGVISMCEAELAKERDARAEDAALGAVIPS